MAAVAGDTHTAMNARIHLILLAWLLLPLTTTLAILSSLCGRICNLLWRRARTPRSKSHTILISGPSPLAVCLARSLKARGQRVIGAALTQFPDSSTSFSISFRPFHKLYSKIQWRKRQKTLVLRGIKIRFDVNLPVFLGRAPTKTEDLAQEILSVVRREKPSIWVPCSSDSGVDAIHIKSTIETLRAHGAIGILSADVDTAEMLTDESAFTEYVEQLETDIRAPEYHIVTSRHEIHTKLASKQKSHTRWELEEDMEATIPRPTKKLSFEDNSHQRRYTWPGPPTDTITPPQSRKNSPTQAAYPTTYGRVVLPRQSLNATYDCVAGMAISHERPWVMRETISGQKILAHLLVVHNELRAFVATLPSSTAAGNEEAEIIPTTSSLYRPLFSFAEAFTSSLPDDTSSFFSLHFVISGMATTAGTRNTIYATSCSVGPHRNAPTLLSISRESSAILATAITDLAPSHPQPLSKDAINHTVFLSSPHNRSSSTAARGVYSFFPALLTLVLLPLLRVLTRTGSLLAFLEHSLLFCEKALLWKEELFDISDPWPWWWEWNVRRPLDLLAEVRMGL